MTDTRLAIAIADEAGIHDAPTIVTWTEIFNLIDAARDYERKACAAVCDQMQENYKKFYRVALDDQPYDPAHGEGSELKALRSLCRQLYEAELTKNQQDWTAVIRALEKVGADSTALTGSNV